MDDADITEEAMEDARLLLIALLVELAMEELATELAILEELESNEHAEL